MTPLTTGRAFSRSRARRSISGRRFTIQFNGHVMLAAAWSTQIAGHASGENFGLDLTNFPHQQGNLKFEVEF